MSPRCMYMYRWASLGVDLRCLCMEAYSLAQLYMYREIPHDYYNNCIHYKEEAPTLWADKFTQNDRDSRESSLVLMCSV